MMSNRDTAIHIFRSAVDAVQPSTLLPAFLQLKKDHYRIADRSYHFKDYKHLLVIGAGKATAAMAKVTEDILKDHIEAGCIAVKYQHTVPLHSIRQIEAAHPVPDENSLAAAQALQQLLQHVTAEYLILCLISGGGSSLLVDCPAGISLRELQQVFNLLLASGATIREMNTVRKHLSAIKGGGLARLANPATLVTLILSDVMGDPLDVIASGPTVPDPTHYTDAWNILNHYHLLEKIPPPVIQHLEKGVAGKIPETPKANDPVFNRVHNYIIANNTIALEAARKKAVELEYETIMITNRLSGEARLAAQEWTALALQYKNSQKKICLLAGGETTVTVRGQGLGGRNQELALAAAIALENEMGITVLACGTDGTDGPTDATGAVADASTMTTAAAMHLKAQEYLDNNDAYTFFEQTGGLIKTGPTHTNVMDLLVTLVEANS